ncbi:MAG: 2-phospho-L-lactate guanylyltransferase [Baekduia sp.]
MTTFAVLPVKRLPQAKQRLGEALPAGTRRALAEAMLTDVLIALRRTKSLDAVLVVTGDETVSALAGGYDVADVVTDREDKGHNEAAMLGVRAARERGAERVLLLPGDVPALSPSELDELLSRPRSAPAVVIVPDRHGTGTNGLLLSGPEVITPAFGPGSRARHVDLAAAAAASCEVAEVPSLALDVDTGDDLEALLERLGTVHGGAANTRGLLVRIGRG